MRMTTNLKLNILFVDDDPDELMIFQDAVSDSDQEYEVTHVLNCDELEAYLASEKPLPDVVFLDINMPGVNGMDCLKIIRKNSRFTEIPIFMYSTSSNRQHIDQSRSSGADLYIIKQSSFEKTRSIFRTVFSTLRQRSLAGLRERFIIS